MEKRNFRNVDEYIAAQPEPAQAALELVRRTIRMTVPTAAHEVVSYKMPAYKLNDSIILYFAGWKQHYSLYPVGERLMAALGTKLRSYELSKGTIRFPLSEPVPAKLIESIAKFRAKEALQQEKSKPLRKYEICAE
jgi:uncharacterized protein YdhG (YjbR/CyaY superfamily)